MGDRLPLANSAPATKLLLELTSLCRRARRARSASELSFMAVNDTHALSPYRQAALWFVDRGIRTLSGVVEPEANAPYAQWLHQVCLHLHHQHVETCAITAIQLPSALAAEWSDWLPPHALWLPLLSDSEGDEPGGLLLAADHPWQTETITVLTEWMQVWHHAWLARTRPEGWSWPRLKHRLLGARTAPDARWWQQRRIRLGVATLAVLCIPVRLSVLAPGELVPAHPAVIRAPLDGVIAQFHVQPNQTVQTGQALFSFDEAQIAARHEVATQALATAQAEYRQQAQQALSDSRSKAQLSALLGKIEEKRAEASYVKGQLERSRVSAPQDGIVLFDDPSEWTGKPVQTGERIMRISGSSDVEVEAWLPMGDAIPLPDQAVVSLYLAANPLTPITATVRYAAHDAVLRPDGTYAYRVRAQLDAPTTQRIGLKGTAKISGDWVPLAYWVVRRPLATVRQTIGL